MADANTLGGLIGGMLIGIAAALLMLFNGRIAGVSGILDGIFSSPYGSERFWRAAFVMGLIAGAACYVLAGGKLAEIQTSTPIALIAGLLVGIGTRLGSGCTSGHGVCGLARRSPRSLVATLTFIASGILTVAVMRHGF
jgi:uncharacterized membrane protein YedE/YeeE